MKAEMGCTFRVRIVEPPQPRKGKRRPAWVVLEAASPHHSVSLFLNRRQLNRLIGELEVCADEVELDADFPHGRPPP